MGHQGNGLPPTTILRFKQQLARAAMLQKSGGCTTTGFALIMGLEKDPHISIRQEILFTWLELLTSPLIQHEALEKAWDKRGEALMEQCATPGGTKSPAQWPQSRPPSWT